MIDLAVCEVHRCFCLQFNTFSRIKHCKDALEFTDPMNFSHRISDFCFPQR
jgi:hypothetical protein